MQVFSCEHCEIFKNSFFIEHIWWLLDSRSPSKLWQKNLNFFHFLISLFYLIQLMYSENKKVCSKYEFNNTVQNTVVNPLSASPTKWSNTLKQFVGNLPTNCLSVFDHFVILALKGLKPLFHFIAVAFTSVYLRKIKNEAFAKCATIIKKLGLGGFSTWSQNFVK